MHGSIHHPRAWNDRRADLRISDRDRATAERRLARHHRAGRLTDDEHAERTDAVRTARTVGDLDTVLGDLDPWAGRGPGGGWHGVRRGGPPFPLFGVVLLVGIVLAATGVLAWTPVLVVAGLVLLLTPWHRRRSRWTARRGWAC